MTTPDWEGRDCVAIIRIDEAVAKPLLGLKTQPDSEVWDAFLSQLGRHIATLDGFQPIGLRVASTKGRPTLARIENEGKLAGLHIDAWERITLPQRADCRSLLTVNLGVEPRFVYFMRPTAVELALKAGQEVSVEAEIDPMVPLREFFKQHPQEPVYRVRVDPGEGYILNVENIVHDGAPFDPAGDAIDTIFSVRGYFNPAA